MKSVFIFLIMACVLSMSVFALTVSRSVPNNVVPNSIIQISYTVTPPPDNWFVGIEESVNGGCSFEGQDHIQFPQMAGSGNTFSIPLNIGGGTSCVLSGDWIFSVDGINPITTNFADVVINISGNCTPACVGRVCGVDGCGGSCGSCSANMMCSNGQCVSLPPGPSPTPSPSVTPNNQTGSCWYANSSGKCILSQGLGIFIIILIIFYLVFIR
jgi:hypothetical protein